MQKCQTDVIPCQLLLLEPGAPLCSNYTYIGTLDAAQNLHCDDSAVLLLSAPDGCTTLPSTPNNVIVTDLPLAALFNRIATLASVDDSEFNRVRSTTSFLIDVLEERLTTEEDISFRTKSLPKPLDTFLSCIVIRTKAPTDQQKLIQMMQELETIFPNDNYAPYQHEIVLLHTQKERLFYKFDWDTDAFTDFLHRHDAYAGISHATRSLTHIRTLWQLSKETAHIGQIVQREGSSDCIFSYQDYGMYYIIDLCANEFMQVHHHDDLVYLSHPAVILLCRYDDEHGTNLIDVLFYYLLSQCSVNKTAQRLYMHRNTVLNRLNKIDEITHLSLNDGYLQIYLIFSCLIMRYYERFMGKQVKR